MFYNRMIEKVNLISQQQKQHLYKGSDLRSCLNVSIRANQGWSEQSRNQWEVKRGHGVLGGHMGPYGSNCGHKSQIMPLGAIGGYMKPSEVIGRHGVIGGYREP